MNWLLFGSLVMGFGMVLSAITVSVFDDWDLGGKYAIIVFVGYVIAMVGYVIEQRKCWKQMDESYKRIEEILK